MAGLQGNSGVYALQPPTTAAVGFVGHAEFQPVITSQHFPPRIQSPACLCHFKMQIPQGNTLSASSACSLSLAGCRALGKPSLDHALGWDPIIGPSRLHSTAAPAPAHSRPVHQPRAHGTGQQHICEEQGLCGGLLGSKGLPSNSLLKGILKEKLAVGNIKVPIS